ncbi:FliO/MopB family protein [Dokdonella sp. MW10]|uniref:FliO/MopB family protein n=1 Tax=Dokdonella sp. MW10 TaxID=2992926 RepID=UPI003F81B974
MQSTLLSMVVPLVLVVGTMILALVIVRRRYGLVSSDGPLRVKQILAVGPRERVVLLEGDSHTIVIGVTSAQVSRIAVLARDGSPSRDEREDA